MTVFPEEATKTHLDNSGDDPKQARSEIVNLVDRFNQLLTHISDKLGSDEFAGVLNGSFEIRNGNYAMFRPLGNTFDWRIRAQSSVLEFLAGNQVTTPVLQFEQAGLLSTFNGKIRVPNGGASASIETHDGSAFIYLDTGSNDVWLKSANLAYFDAINHNFRSPDSSKINATVQNGEIWINEQDSVNEGGQLALEGAGSYSASYLDNFQNGIRLYHLDTDVTKSLTVGGFGGGASYMNIDVDGGLSVGAPTGGNKGFGTINAHAVYDDNVLLSCYVLDQAIDGGINDAKWDSKVVDRFSPSKKNRKIKATETVIERVVSFDVVDGKAVRKVEEREVKKPIFDEFPVIDEATGLPYEVVVQEAREAFYNKDGKEVSPALPEVKKQAVYRVPRMIDVPDTEGSTQERIHTDMRKFKARIGTKFDPLDIDKFTAHWRSKRHLSPLPNEETYDPENSPMSTGEWLQRLIETVEIYAVHIDTLNQKDKAQQALIDDMTARIESLEGGN